MRKASRSFKTKLNHATIGSGFNFGSAVKYSIFLGADPVSSITPWE